MLAVEVAILRAISARDDLANSTSHAIYAPAMHPKHDCVKVYWSTTEAYIEGKLAAVLGMCEETECDANVTYVHGSRVISECVERRGLSVLMMFRLLIGSFLRRCRRCCRLVRLMSRRGLGVMLSGLMTCLCVGRVSLVWRLSRIMMIWLLVDLLWMFMLMILRCLLNIIVILRINRVVVVLLMGVWRLLIRMLCVRV